MFIQIKPASSKPIYIQIMEQIKYAIASGVAKEGEQLLSVRELARQLCINPNTVAKAYHELERDRYLMTHKGKGVYVAPSTSILTKKEKERLVGEKLEGALVDALNLGLSFKDVNNILKKTMVNFKGQEKYRE
ncbi:GntR family transcriptional regulator [Thermodesulfobacteriota bacterium]